MNTLRSLTFLALTLFSSTLFAQSSEDNQSLRFKLQLLSDRQTWGVFVEPDASIQPTTKTVTGSGQVTIVAPIDFTYANFKNFSGTWMENARVNGPDEAPDQAYISFGFMLDEPKINLYPNEETLLFTFTTDFTGGFNLIDNENDPFAAPNSYSSNPGNDLGIIDFGAGGMTYYTYAGNFTPESGEPMIQQTRKAKAVLTSSHISETAIKTDGNVVINQPNE